MKRGKNKDFVQTLWATVLFHIRVILFKLFRYMFFFILNHANK